MDRRERVSALIDNEVSEFEIRQILNEMLENDDHKASWNRYHIIRDTLQGNLPGTIRTGFADTVMSHIYSLTESESGDGALDEPELTPETPNRPAKNNRPVYGIALAASLALVAVLVHQLQPVQNLPTTTVAPQVADAVPTQVTPNVADAVPVQVTSNAQTQQGAEQEQAPVMQTNYATISPFDNNALSSYLMNHAEYAGSQGMIPHARIVGYEISNR